MHAAAKYFATAGIIGFSKPERLIIDEADSMRTEHMRIFSNQEGDGYYALLFQVLNSQNFNTVMEAFFNKVYGQSNA
jgi:hypothetical protein